jgi:hypothetical protein|tara:strand:+ start:126 stop:683 length:558 start_codon:yes stop_codon:yes gene_type:complete
MLKEIVFLLASFLDSGVNEKLVVIDYVDMIEVNHKYYESHQRDVPEFKKQFIQIIFWEYRKNVLLPEYKDGEKTAYWKQGSDYVVMDYFTLYNDNYGLTKKNGIQPYLYKGKWHTHYYDEGDECYRIVIAKQIKITYTLYDPEVLNSRIVKEDSRKELTKPDRHVIVKEIPKDIERILDMVIEVK